MIVPSKPEVRIEDYALIGNCTTAALVGRNGSIDWLALPRFDAAACFAALLGTPNNGRWLIAPAEPVRNVSRRYRGNTMILETQFTCDSGVVTLIDFMPKPRQGIVDVMRIVRGERGTVPMRFEAIFRFDYGSIVPWVRRRAHGLRAVAGPDAIVLRTAIALVGKDKTTVGEFSVRAGETVPCTLSWCRSYVDEPPALDAAAALDDTEDYWRKWSARCTPEAGGEWHDAVMRSLLTLKALTYAPTGGIVAAPTTSLPEKLGGGRNWDYRYCWLRDAAFTLFAFILAGYVDEAKTWREWLLRAVAGAPADMQIMYGIAGERRLGEHELPWLAGYAGSRPVRIGNAAHLQRQLDIYGDVMDVFYTARVYGAEPEDDVERIQQALLEYLEGNWQKPDSGIWEARSAEKRNTHSAVMAWVAFDRAVRSAEKFGLKGPAKRWAAVRDQIHREVCTQGIDSERGVFVQQFGGKALDAALLRIPLVGFLPPDDPRVIKTMDAVAHELTLDGLVRRYIPEHAPDGLAGDEGAFLICSFWLADNYALVGRRREARTLFERLLALRNDVGLLAEEYDPHARRLLGNFPQAFSHVGLINTAHNLTLHRGPAEHRVNG
ncbi:MAG: glycoside hydrolase family 15 protein [Alphaproteobacteria bacterium]|nr:glycoside hydrolase family 15 protein [Alphaproteobacteria bacterium]